MTARPEPLRSLRWHANIGRQQEDYAQE